jgi:3-isopropylmalate/(R)-2-methylmalate dehydratase large subunit
MGFTFAEKIISRKSGRQVRAGDTAIAEVDVSMVSDTTGPLAIQAFREMGGTQVKKTAQTVFVIDHATPTPNEKIANLQQMLRVFAGEQKLVLYDQGDGVCHQLMLEKGHVRSGQLVLGADSHTCTYGAVGSFASGVGSTDLGAVLLTGKAWLRVPESAQVNLSGVLPPFSTAKDLVLRMAGRLTADGATYLAMEFGGAAAEAMNLDDRMVIANMAVEMGAKTGVFLCAIEDVELRPDSGATYRIRLDFDLSETVPMLACPHTVDNVAPVSEKAGLEIHQAYLGSCTNGRLNDIAAAAQILRGRQVAPGVRMLVAPASRTVLLEAIRKKYISQLVEAGATILPPGCGACVGTLGGIPCDGDVVVSTTNRNFKGRMGNNKAFIYLASPLTVAASALTGRVTDPREVMA